MQQILLDLIAGWPGLMSRPDIQLIEDCEVLLPFLGAGGRLLDAGSGGGLPGLPLKLARPDLRVTLLEADRTKAAFLNMAVARLGLEGVEVLGVRAELAGHDPGHREGYDLVTARALAAMPVLAELCLPFLRIGGRLLAMKTAAAAEVEAALPALARLGGELVEIAAAPTSARGQGQVVVILKTAPTPPQFPRRPGVPGRRPLS